MEISRGIPARSCRTNKTLFFFFSSRRRHTRLVSDWSSDVCSSDLVSICCKSRLGTVMFPNLPLEPSGGAGRTARVCIATYEILGPSKNGGIGTAYHSLAATLAAANHYVTIRSEERRVGKECRSRWS